LWAGWRWVMVIGGTGGLFGWAAWRCLRESPRWLECRGRYDEAGKVIAEMELQVEREIGRTLPSPQPLTIEVAERMPFRELWTPTYRGRTTMLIIFNLLQTVGFYGFANWAPTFLLHEGRTLGQSLNFSFLFALMNPIGPLIGIATTERLERKHALVLLSLLMACTGLAFAFARNILAIIAVGATMTIFTSWFSSVFHAYQAELFPTRARATGVGFTYSWSRLSAVFSSLIIGTLLIHGILVVFVFIALAMVGVALVVGIWGPRTNALTLEEISN
ncbi:MAG: MFS transporter, partial [Terracidiphilus sp.]